MPIYEFYCPENHKIYQFLARSQAYRDVVPLCPDNPAYSLRRQVSRFAILGKAKEELEGDPFADVDDARMEALMADLEGDMNTLDDANPDPHQLGRVMRKMTDLMGDKAPPELREAIRRLEAGEDPEKLEAEFGGDDANTDAWLGQAKKILHRSRQPIRDPKLYELRDWLPPTP